jgi:hypothetical protein
MTTPAMMKYYNEIMNPKKKQKKNKDGEDQDQTQQQMGLLGFAPGQPQPPTDQLLKPKQKVKRPWEVRHEKMEKKFNPELEKTGLPTSFTGKGKKRKNEE